MPPPALWSPSVLKDDPIEYEVAKQIDQTIDGLQPQSNGCALSKMANVLYENNKQTIEKLKANLKAGVHDKMADAIAEVRDLDCECREKWANFIEKGFQFEIAILQSANDKIIDLIQSKYMQVATSLKRDLLIFTGCNAGVFLLLLIVSFLKPGAINHLFLPGSLLTLSTLICSYLYVFKQNWLLTILYSNYLGFMYLGYLGIVFGILCEIVFNKARITTKIINLILSIAGSAASFSPC